MTDPRQDTSPSSSTAPVVDQSTFDGLPPRPVWSSKTPDTPWCPEEWHAHLEAVVPSWTRAVAASHADALEVTMASLKRAPWSGVAVSRRGRLHAHRGDFREDAITLRTHATGWCAAVADGAGSSAWSRVGSAVATHTFCTVFAESMGSPETRAHAASLAVFDTMRALATRVDLPPRALRTTLLAVAIDGDELITVQVGDGGIVLVDTDGSIRAPQLGDSGEFSGDVTHFLPDDGTGERLAASLHVTRADGVRAVLLASDGIEDPWYPLPRHAPMLVQSLEHGVADTTAAAIAAATDVIVTSRGPVAEANVPVSALAEWMTFEKRGENDDRSLLFARRQ